MENELDYIYIGLLMRCELGMIEIPFTKYNAYGRIETSMTGLEWAFIDDENITNVIPFTFPEAKMPWGMITNFGIFNKPRGGQLIAIGDLSHSGRICKGMQVQFDAYSLIIAEQALEIK